MPGQGEGSRTVVLVSALGQRCQDGLSLKCDTAKTCPSSPVLGAPVAQRSCELAFSAIVHWEGAASRRSGPPQRRDGLPATKGEFCKSSE